MSFLEVLTASLLLARPVVSLETKSGVGRLPALGWNSWNAYHCDVNQDKIMEAAQAFIDLGLKDAGYEYVNIDDCWSIKDGRDSSTNRLQPDLSKFPDGINGTAAKIHDLGLKVGIYSSAGTQTCAGWPASIGYEDIDAQTWAEWGIDYLKYDNCNIPSNWTDTCNPCYLDSVDGPNGTCIKSSQPLCEPGYDFAQSNTAHRYAIMRDALLAQDRPIHYALCEWGTADVISWGNTTAQSWRTTNDIDPSWSRILSILNQNSFMTHAGNFYGHNDPDMLEVGNGDLTFEQCRSHFALWAALKSPLLIGTNLKNLSTELVDVIKNPYLLAFNQDEQIGESAAPYKWGTNPDWTFDAEHPAQYWAGKSSNGTLVLLFNTNDTTASMSFAYSEIGSLTGANAYNVVDVWSGKSLGCNTGGVTNDVASHDTAAFLVQDKC